MGIKVTAKTKAKASLKLYNQINSYLFEEQYGEVRYNGAVVSVLMKAKEELSKLINNAK